MQMRRLELTGDQVGFSAIYSWDQFLGDFPAPGLPITVLKHVRGTSSCGPGGELQCPAILESFTEWLFLGSSTAWLYGVVHHLDFFGSLSKLHMVLRYTRGVHQHSRPGGALHHAASEEPFIMLPASSWSPSLHCPRVLYHAARLFLEPFIVPSLRSPSPCHPALLGLLHPAVTEESFTTPPGSSRASVKEQRLDFTYSYPWRSCCRRKPAYGFWELCHRTAEQKSGLIVPHFLLLAIKIGASHD
ncbi:uncharacterized protein LOC115345083 [Aquila chrysaetos chrysaetos]|uniref:uncharacterized protein LOC115345083 n=1 Tax=Aquila chrysaetos chrysaetos TaxID=223781 RepID=UPI00117720EA|nr:uncharacterized protein LOC115345083 [Aquila chrysaetos chrysaetos]